MKKILVFSVLLSLLLSLQPAQATIGLGLGVKASTLGIGFEITKSTIDKLNIRAGMASYKFAFDGEMTEQEVEYAADLNLSSWQLMADYHPWNKSFHLSLGVIGNGNKVETTITPMTEQTMGGRTYSVERQGQLFSTFDWAKIAPYFGLGWGNAAQPGRGLGFNLDIGAMYQNSPNIELVGTEMLTPTAELNQQLFDDSFEGAKVWFVMSLSLSFSF